jgi:ABC-type lipopolysaccharide export system ATPase subunit
LLDEPFKGIAPVFREDIKNLIRQKSNEKGFIVTDHDYSNILDISTNTFLLFDGGLKPIQSKEDLRQWGYLP